MVQKTIYACLERGDDDVARSSQRSNVKGGIVRFIIDCMLCLACLACTDNVTYVFLERNGEKVSSSQQSAVESNTDVETDIDVGKELMEVSSSQQSAVKGGDL